MTQPFRSDTGPSNAERTVSSVLAMVLGVVFPYPYIEGRLKTRAWMLVLKYYWRYRK